MELEEERNTKSRLSGFRVSIRLHILGIFGSSFPQYCLIFSYEIVCLPPIGFSGLPDFWQAPGLVPQPKYRAGSQIRCLLCAEK